MEINIESYLKFLEIEPVKNKPYQEFYNKTINNCNNILLINNDILKSSNELGKLKSQNNENLFVIQIKYDNVKWRIYRFFNDFLEIFKYLKRTFRIKNIEIPKHNNNKDELLIELVDILNILKVNEDLNNNPNPLNDFLEFSILNINYNKTKIFKQLYLKKYIGKNSNDNIIIKFIKNNIKLKRWFVITQHSIIYMVNSKLKSINLRENNFIDTSIKLKIISKNS